MFFIDVCRKDKKKRGTRKERFVKISIVQKLVLVKNSKNSLNLLGLVKNVFVMYSVSIHMAQHLEE